MIGRNKSVLVILATMIISAVFFAVQFRQGQHMNYYADAFGESLSLESAGDRQLVYSLPAQGDYLECSVIFADEISDTPLHLRIYYTDELSDFSEDKAVNVTADVTEDHVYFALPRDITAVKYIRIDFDSNLSSVPTVLSVGLQEDSRLSRLASFVLGFLYDYQFVIPLLLLAIFYSAVYYIQNWQQNSSRRDLSVIVIMAASLFLLYFDYLLGDSAFCFHGDSFQQTYPGFVSVAERIADGIWNARVNFKQSLGNREGSLMLTLENWFCIFGEENVFKWIGINYYLKAVLSGILAYYWAKTYSGNSETGFMIAFAYAMSSEFVARCDWYSYSNRALLLVFWLLAYELWHRQREWRLLPFATMFYFYGSGVYYCLVWGFLLAFYILFRELEDAKDKVPWKRWMQTELLYISFAALGIADTLIAQLRATFSSTRFTEVSSGLSFLDYGIIGGRHVIFTAILRALGPAIMGVGDHRGYYNILEGPAFYCGLLLLLLVPVAIYNLEGRKRICYILAVLASCIYIVVTPLRVIANGFRDDTFKLSSFWICVFMLILSMEILTRIFSGVELRKGSGEVFQITVVIAVGLLLISSKWAYIQNIKATLWCVLFMVIYMIIMQRVCQKDNRRLFVSSLCLIFAAETIVFSWPVINEGGKIGVEEMQRKRTYYNDYTVDAVKYIAQRDEGWYRLEKSYSSVEYCDSLVQDYYGLASYIGGTEADPGILAIYRAYGLTRDSVDYHGLGGSGGNIYAASLLSTKYFLSKEKTNDRYGLQYLTEFGNVSVYENRLALPFAYTYEQTISEDEFEQLSLYDRSRNILDKCVVSAQGVNVQSAEPSIFHFEDLSGYEKLYEKSDETTYLTDHDPNSVLVVRMMMSDEGHRQPVEILDENGDMISLEKISYFAGERVVEIYCDEMRSIRFSDEMCADMESIEFYEVDAEQYYDELEKGIDKLQNHAMTVTAHDDIYNHIEGTVDCEKPGVLATSIPFNDGWKILVDGQAVEVITVNSGLVGCYLDQGKHDIAIYYDGKSWLEANIFKTIGFIAALSILAVWIFKKYYRVRSDRNDKHISGSAGLQ